MGRYDILLGEDKKPDDTGKTESSATRAEKLSAASIQREVHDAPKKDDGADSLFFPQQVRSGERRSQSTPVSPVQPVRPVLPVRGTNTIKRIMKSRHPFDIYQDQYESLKQLALQDRMQGGDGSMSAMVREAIDTWIQKRRGK